MISSDKLHAFQEIVRDYYRAFGRDLPWREAPFDAYRILVSEIMLQQTQAARVVPKYRTFLKRFPTVDDLANATLGDVLRAWSGLGYNRRAKYLHEAAKHLVSKDSPWKLQDLTVCKGIGYNTAAAVCVYAYNEPRVFIETNIRTVLIHHFFNDQSDVTDKELLPLIEASMDKEYPREFYWALMDYGTHLKKTIGNSSRQSRHYAKQTKFEGSLRQIRGQVLKILSTGSYTAAQLEKAITDDRLPAVLEALLKEQLITRRRGRFTL